MGTLFIDRRGVHVKLDGNAISFYADGAREGMVPIAPLKRVVIVGTVTIESSVLSRLADQGISVVFLSGRTARFAGALHGRLHNNAPLRLAQYDKSRTAFAAGLSVEIVTDKIAGQTALLRRAMQERPDRRLRLTEAAATLDGISRSLDNLTFGGDRAQAGPFLELLRGYEGAASAAYFPAYASLFAESLAFTRRTRRPPADPVNAVLSLCYTLAHFELVRECEVIGLDPTVGFYHGFEYGRESLACDMVEVFRPDVDGFVWSLFRDRTLTARDFVVDEDKPGCYLKKESRKAFYPLYEEWAKAERPLFTEKMRELARRIMDGQDPLSE